MKILIAYDKNISTSKVMDQAFLRAKKLGAYVYLARTCAPDTKLRTIKQLESQLEELGQEIFVSHGVECETHVLIRGLTPAEDIVWYAKEKQVDEIIIGIKKKSKVGKLVFGSTAQYIILEAHCPVLSVK
ncbi:MAG: universal stress protein [Desulfobacula sp.]|jgi:nucleotide-binding universal stress UspA family protein|uniref:universal stress protein n=1 Tax=Desulfobacula sp. TaxID=2593537 RepID=UPI001D7AD730|nr:universal stress protein [Desulfobacula sp.]MBT3483736.1 universal stress protein [Desulfobacula sp.]MBT3803488.1 universal stress protein [Desulfobacula sp.]MBT4023283.1 universal stress protein [Desulfobacula sp.]MBT4197269.1 universal stress protein [Desulfobacula sp.]